MLLLLLIPLPIFAQSLYIDNGIAISKSKSDIFGTGETSITYSPMLGIDYLNHYHWNLTNEIGFITKGNIVSNWVDNNGITIIDQIKLHYIQIDALFRYKVHVNTFTIYAGIGPKFDILVSKSTKYQQYLKEYDFNSINYGVKPVFGILHTKNKLSLGLNFSYLVNFNCLAENRAIYLKFNNDTYRVAASIGYTF